MSKVISRNRCTTTRYLLTTDCEWFQVPLALVQACSCFFGHFRQGTLLHPYGQASCEVVWLALLAPLHKVVFYLGPQDDMFVVRTNACVGYWGRFFYIKNQNNYCKDVLHGYFGLYTIKHSRLSRVNICLLIKENLDSCTVPPVNIQQETVVKR